MKDQPDFDESGFEEDDVFHQAVAGAFLRIAPSQVGSDADQQTKDASQPVESEQTVAFDPPSDDDETDQDGAAFADLDQAPSELGASPETLQRAEASAVDIADAPAPSTSQPSIASDGQEKLAPPPVPNNDIVNATIDTAPIPDADPAPQPGASHFIAPTADASAPEAPELLTPNTTLGSNGVRQMLPGAPADLQTLADYLNGISSGTTDYWQETGFQASPYFNLGTTGTGAKSGTLHYNISGFTSINFAGTDADGLTAARADMVRHALNVYSDILGITFVETTSVDPNVVDIFFGDNTPGQAFSGNSYFTSNGATAYGWVFIDEFWDSGNSAIGSFAFHTALHEIGHVLGLGHSGPYNGPATYSADARWQNDSWQQSMMSYWSQTDNTDINASYAPVIGPMAVDWLALDQIYGSQGYGIADGTTTGDTVWGFNDTWFTWGAGGSPLVGYANSAYASMSTLLGTNAMAIVDGGGIDTLDLSGFNNNTTIDMRVALATSTTGSISSVAGLTGNLTLAVGTVIENVVGGGAGETIMTNDADNLITGGGGNDVITAYGGADTAIYFGDSSNYTVTLLQSGDVQVTDNRTQTQINTDAGGTGVSDGTDTLTGVESLQFKDGTFAVSAFQTDDYADSIADLSAPIGSFVKNIDATGDIEVAGDKDVFEVYLVSGETYTFSNKGAASSNGTNTDPTVALQDVNGNQLGFSDGTYDQGGGLTSLDAELVYTATTTGTHYIVAGGYQDTRTGTYTLSVTSDRDDYADIFFGASEPVGSLQNNVSATGEVEISGDLDLFSMTLLAGVEYAIDLQGLDSGLGTLDDSVLGLFDSTGALITTNNDRTDGSGNPVSLESQIIFTPTTTADYFIAATGYVTPGGYGNDTGTYTVTVSSTTNSAPTGAVTISGQAKQGSTLTANASAVADYDGLGTFSYQWLRDGAVIGGATGATYALKQSDVGKAISVRVSYTDLGGTAETVTSAATAKVQNVNDAVQGAVTISGTAKQGQTLTADASGLSDADGLGTFSYQWFSNGAAIARATTSSLTLTQAEVGKTITVRVSYVDGGGTAESKTSAATSAVQNVNDPVSGTVLIAGTAREGQTLVADATGLSDPDGLGTFSYQWLSNGAAISGATGSSYDLTGADVGKAISVRVSYTDGGGTAESKTSAQTAAVDNLNDPVTGAVTIQGTVRQGQVLTANTSGLSDGDGLGAFSYQWFSGGVAVAGANAKTYTPGQSDVGKALTVRVSYVDGGGTAESKTSAATAAVANVNDPVQGQVLITGTARQGATLTADATGLTDADGLGTFAYQWLSDGQVIAGATQKTLVLGQAQVGANISVRVTYTDDLGSSESKTSAATADVLNVNDPVQGAVAITGQVRQGATLTADASGLSDPDGLGTFSYQWLSDGQVIAGATQKTLTLGQSEVGKPISVRVSYTDGEGTAETKTSAQTADVANVNDPVVGNVKIGGKAVQGKTLTAKAGGLSDADGLGPFSYEWLSGGKVIKGADEKKYTTTQSDVGKVIKVRVTYTDGEGATETKTSKATKSVRNVDDPSTGRLKIKGEAGIPDTMVAKIKKLKDADGVGVLTYAWLRDGLVIDGETNPTYTPTKADLGATLAVRVTHTDAAGFVTVFESAPSEPVDYVDQRIVGNKKDNKLTGDGGDDTIIGKAGKDVLNGKDGDDFLSGDEDNDKMTGGDGDDQMDGGDGNDQMKGNAGKDVMNGGKGKDKLDGGADKDKLNGDAGDDRLIGGDGNDNLKGGSGADDMRGGAGKDKMFGGSEDDTMDGGDEKDKMSGEAGDDVMDGGEGNDTLSGGDDNDDLVGNKGNDTLRGDKGRDNLDGGDGNDKLNGGDGNDALKGGQGDDQLTGGAGVDKFEYTGGADTITDFGDTPKSSDQEIISIDKSIGSFGSEAEILALATATAGGTTFDFGGGNTLTFSFVTVSDLKGAFEFDNTGPGPGPKPILGDDKNNTLNGTANDDVIDGKGGNDIINGLAGDDSLTGGTGLDTFVFTAGRDVITDITAGETIRIAQSVGTFTSLADVLSKSSAGGAGLTFDFGAGNVLVLEGRTDATGLNFQYTKKDPTGPIRRPFFDEETDGGFDHDATDYVFAL